MRESYIKVSKDSSLNLIHLEKNTNFTQAFQLDLGKTGNNDPLCLDQTKVLVLSHKVDLSKFSLPQLSQTCLDFLSCLVKFMVLANQVLKSPHDKYLVLVPMWDTVSKNELNWFSSYKDNCITSSSGKVTISYRLDEQSSNLNVTIELDNIRGRLQNSATFSINLDNALHDTKEEENVLYRPYLIERTNQQASVWSSLNGLEKSKLLSLPHKHLTEPFKTLEEEYVTYRVRDDEKIDLLLNTLSGTSFPTTLTSHLVEKIVTSSGTKDRNVLDEAEEVFTSARDVLQDDSSHIEITPSTPPLSTQQPPEESSSGSQLPIEESDDGVTSTDLNLTDGETEQQHQGLNPRLTETSKRSFLFTFVKVCLYLCCGIIVMFLCLTWVFRSGVERVDRWFAWVRENLLSLGWKVRRVRLKKDSRGSLIIWLEE